VRAMRRVRREPAPAAPPAGRSPLVTLLIVALLGASAGCREKPVLAPVPELDRMAPADRSAILDARHAIEEGTGVNAWFDYARALFDAQQTDLGEEALLRAAEIEGADRFLCFYVAGFVASPVARERAVLLFDRAIAERGDFALAHIRVGTVLLELDRADEANAHFERALALGAVGLANLGLGRVALLRGDTAGAIKALEKARAGAPGNVDVLLALASAYRRAGNAEIAAAVARSVPPDHRSTYIPDPLLDDFFRKRR